MARTVQISKEKLRAGVYGGTFNPIHNGHVHLLQELAQRLRLDKIYLIPARIPPHKQAPGLASAAHRLAMCRLAAASLPGLPVDVSDMELRRDGPSYTVDTLAALREAAPDETLYLLMGEDMFLTVDRWYQAARIMEMSILCGVPRGGEVEMLRQKADALKEEYGARCVVEAVPFVDVSSTVVREKTAAGEDISALVPADVAAYIRAHGLYQSPGHINAK